MLNEKGLNEIIYVKWYEVGKTKYILNYVNNKFYKRKGSDSHSKLLRVIT